MKTSVTFFCSGLALVLSLAGAFAQSPSRAMTHAEMSRQSWLTNYYGKPLNSLGEITSIKVERGQPANPAITNQMHTAMEIIEHSKIQDDQSVSVAFGLPPIFSIEFADGTRVRCSYLTAVITMPDGRGGSVVLMPPPNPALTPTPPQPVH